MEGLTPIGWDTETRLIGQECQAPQIMCSSVASYIPGAVGLGYTEHEVIDNTDLAALEASIRWLLEDPAIAIVGQAVGYDLSVAASNFPALIPLIFKALEDERVFDTIIREKLLYLGTTGDLEYVEMPDGSKMKAKWSLDVFVQRYFGIDIKADKSDTDSWRLNFGLFDKIPVAQWPPGAVKYAADDAIYALNIATIQEEQRKKVIAERGIDPLKSQGFRVMVDFCLRLMSCWGAAVDPAEIAKLEAEVRERLSPEKMNLLIDNCILRPATPPKPSSRRDHVPGCTKKGCACPVRMTSGEKESIDTKCLQEYIIAFADRMNAGKEEAHHVVKLRKTKTGISTDAEFMEDYAHLDPVLTQYQKRQEWQKVVTTEIPRMKLRGEYVAIVHPQYDCLKESGRTSSYAPKDAEYASCNIQNIDPRARRCYVPRPGWLLFSCDNSQMELCTLSQKCFNLFGYSVMRDKINAGVDLHAFTGAQLAFAMDLTFNHRCDAAKVENRDQIYDIFKQLEKGTSEEQAVYANYRKFAKPVNFGYPGGLGATTFVRFAKVSYDVHIDEPTAKVFKDLWKETYPEMSDYFNYINKECKDPFNKGWDEENKKEKDKYCFTSPFGMHRAGADYCSCSNGLGVQTPAAEGALCGLISVQRYCYDWTCGSILGPDASGPTVRPWGFIHDEIVGEIREDNLVHERMMEIKRIMSESLRLVTPDVVTNANPSLMRRWDKDAKPVFDANGRLTIWTPKGK